MMLFKACTGGGRYLIITILSLFVFFHSHVSADTQTAEPTDIKLLQGQMLFSYNDRIRLSQVFTQAYTHINHDVYSLGTTLVNLNKQPMIDDTLQTLIAKLEQVGTDESLRVIKQLTELRFAYREKIHTNFNQVRVNPLFDPMLSGKYLLSLPKRPDTIMLISPTESTRIILPFKNDRDVTFYLDALTHTDNRRPIWVIQADQTVYPIQDHDWKNTRFFLAPGAIVFVELTHLPVEYKTLNSDIAHFLAYRLEP